ncbi:MAG: cache domain-containing protein [Campylobacterota bacterium]|nr:cache domain-containing protein [Campylobacterota bacterium]
MLVFWVLNGYVVSIITIVLCFIGLNIYKSTITDEVYKNTKIELTSLLHNNLEAKKDIGITNAYSIANDGLIQTALKDNKRELAINSLDTISQTFKSNTAFKNIKVHIHTKDNKSYLRNWKQDKFGDDLSLAEAANEIKALVENAAKKANEGQTISKNMIDGYNDLNTNINSTLKLIHEVANAAKEQQSSMAQISNTVNELDNVTQQNASVATNISSMDLYAGGYADGQVFSVTDNVEKNMNQVFELLDLLREDKCTRLRESRG